MAIEVSEAKIDKTKKAYPLWILSIALALIVAGAYGYIYFLTNRIEGEIKGKETQIEEIKRGIAEKERYVESTSKKISDFRMILEEQKNVVRIFSVVEGMTHPSVWFNSFSFETSTGKASLTGEARDFTALGQQIMIARDFSGLNNPSFSNIRETESGVGFSLSFEINPQILR